MDFFLTVGIFIGVLGILVCLHELGHFFAAKLFRVRVDEFGVGFPPRVLSVAYRGTVYSLNLLPLGGFVRIKGIAGERIEQVRNGTEHESEVERATDHDSFSVKPGWQRLSILLAGIAANIVVAVILFSASYMVGVQAPVSQERAESGNTEELRLLVTNIVQESPAANAGMKRGDSILAVAGEPVRSINDLQRATTATVGRETPVSILSGGETRTVLVTPQSLTSQATGEEYVGIGVELAITETLRYSFFESVQKGFVATGGAVEGIFYGLWQLVYGALSSAPVEASFTGPVGIAQMSGQAFQIGFPTLLQFMAILSVNLAVFNLLPIPALDGGRLAFLVAELIRGKPVNERVEAMIHSVGFLFLISLVALVTYKDIASFLAR